MILTFLIIAKYNIINSIVKEGLILAKLANKLILPLLSYKDNNNNLLSLYYNSNNTIKIITNRKLSTRVI